MVFSIFPLQFFLSIPGRGLLVERVREIDKLDAYCILCWSPTIDAQSSILDGSVSDASDSQWVTYLSCKQLGIWHRLFLLQPCTKKHAHRKRDELR